MKHHLSELIDCLGHTGIAALMFLENIFPPLPSEAIMPLAGYLAHNGQLSFWGVILAGSIGSVLGGVPLYFLGRWISHDRLRHWVERYGRWFGVSRRDLERTLAWFHRHGALAVFLGRLVPGVRSLISIPAGMAGMEFWSFLLWSFAGTSLWVALLAGAGYMLGDGYHRIEGAVQTSGWVMAVVTVAGACAWWYLKWRNQTAAATVTSDEAP
jgi:membrane protein DedA with SNARE-associated domain